MAWRPSLAGPVSFNSALTLSSGEFVLRELGVYRRSSDDPGTADRDLRAVGLVSVLGYGIDADLSVFAVLPYFDKRLKVTSGGQRLTRSSSGLGDASLFGRYVLWRENWRGSAFRLSAFGGIETPTGEDNETDGVGRLPAAVQPGSGSWDPFAGLVATYQTLDFQVDGQLAYKANTEANDFEFGDILRADASLQYRLWPRTLSGGVPGFLYGVIEANLIHRGNNRVAGASDPNSGGFTLRLVPGLQYVTRRWVAEAVVEVPVAQNLNGTALENDYVLRAGFRVNF